MSRSSLTMLVLCSTLLASCGAHSTAPRNGDPAVPLDDPNACPISVTLDANATFEAGFLPIGASQQQTPSIDLFISNTGPCPRQATNCSPPAVVGGVTMNVTLTALDANGKGVDPQAGTYPVVTTDPNAPGALAAKVNYLLTTKQNLDPNAVQLTAGTFVIDSIQWSTATAPAVPEVTSLTGHAAFTLPDGSAFAQAFSSVSNCVP